MGVGGLGVGAGPHPHHPPPSYPKPAAEARQWAADDASTPNVADLLEVPNVCGGGSGLARWPLAQNPLNNGPPCHLFDPPLPQGGGGWRNRHRKGVAHYSAPGHRRTLPHYSGGGRGFTLASHGKSPPFCARRVGPVVSYLLATSQGCGRHRLCGRSTSVRPSTPLRRWLRTPSCSSIWWPGNHGPLGCPLCTKEMPGGPATLLSCTVIS